MSEPIPYDTDGCPDGPCCVNWNHPAYEGSMGLAGHEFANAVRNLGNALADAYGLPRTTAWIDRMIGRFTRQP